MKQATNNILMIKPHGFGYNIQTANNNHFQKNNSQLSNDELIIKALDEFDSFVSKLKDNGVNVLIFDDPHTKNTPDAVFPNNWFSTHQNGTVFLYPMFAPNRRLERKMEILELLSAEFLFKTNMIFDMSKYEKSDLFLEGTGSMILDRLNKIIYASVSERTSIELLDIYANKINYELVTFKSYHKVQNENALIYHTNVMMCVASEFCIVCLDAILDLNQKKIVIEHLQKTNKTIIKIDLDQLNHFAGNMLELHNGSQKSLLVMSSTAYNSLSPNQVSQIENFSQIIHSPLDTIEKYGGGSARCMMAEVFLPKLN